jgi:hypothetical protein
MTPKASGEHRGHDPGGFHATCLRDAGGAAFQPTRICNPAAPRRVTLGINRDRQHVDSVR